MLQGWRHRKLALLLPALACQVAFASESPMPIIPDHSILLSKTAITISYNPNHKQADWVFYPLSINELRNCYSRGDNFRPDPELPEDVSAQLSDYAKSGYDRGHLSPAGDNKWSQDAMNESFLLSNISPQPPKFNQGIWGRLEGLVRAWGMKMGGLWVVTGPILHDDLKTIGDNNVSVPGAYYKAIITQDLKHGLGLRLPTNASSDLSRYATKISDIENESGLDFFHGIENESELENSENLADWDFRASFKYAPCNEKNPGDLMDYYFSFAK